MNENLNHIFNSSQELVKSLKELIHNDHENNCTKRIVWITMIRRGAPEQKKVAIRY